MKDVNGRQTQLHLLLETRLGIRLDRLDENDSLIGLDLIGLSSS